MLWEGRTNPREGKTAQLPNHLNQDTTFLRPSVNVILEVSLGTALFIVVMSVLGDCYWILISILLHSMNVICPLEYFDSG